MKFSNNKKLDLLAQSFVDKYKALNSSTLNLDPYNSAYAAQYLEKIEYNTYLACELLKNIDAIDSYDRVFDFGGGIGFNSAFFSFVGFKEVIYVDIDSLSKKDAQTINSALGFNNITYLTSDYTIFKEFDLTKALICSRDVIEHIYDLKSFLLLSSKAKTNRHNTAAVSNSFFRKNEFLKIHHNAEFVGNQNNISKERDSSEPYIQIRETILRDLNPNISEIKLDVLLGQTRGLIKKDIIAFLEDGRLPEHHTSMLNTNTCDPLTGNWAERTLSFKNYEQLASSTGVQLDFNLVDYNTYNQPILKKIALSLLNSITKLSQNERLCASFTLNY
ncbi:MAG: class I SAM-dependent methyltransferase [Bacteroidia bacterium]|nr:class I SAM-dependent methyltransferase [Bacteroidia bacterium]NNJ56690.1 class I SAM-dependent methyltransferase [Bacteroidia bacterium]